MNVMHPASKLREAEIRVAVRETRKSGIRMAENRR